MAATVSVSLPTLIAITECLGAVMVATSSVSLQIDRVIAGSGMVAQEDVVTRLTPLPDNVVSLAAYRTARGGAA